MTTSCTICDHQRAYGRGDRDPIHCRDCHRSWSGVEAQHALCCHLTFTTADAADDHRRADHCDPAATPGWRERRPGVWTNAEPMDKAAKGRIRG